MREMKARGFIDFSVSGTALLSSAVLLRMKSELVLKMEEPPKPQPVKPTDYVPPPLVFPIRYEATTTSLDEVLKGILEVLRAERSLPSSTSQLLTRTPSVFEQTMDDFLVKIEENLKLFYQKLLKESSLGQKLSFLRLVEGADLLEIVRMFIMLLFLAVDGKLRLEQFQEGADITIEVNQAIANSTTN
jgi:chromatin segregation and condensation protein Rec8/ScpA/Scc1 (kleisin family)